MSIASLFLNRRPKLGEIQVDCSVREVHAEPTELSRYPVEGGADQNDHILDGAPSVTLEGLISDVQPELFLGFVPGLATDLHRSRSAWQELLDLKRSHEPFILVTSLAVYTSMVFDNGDSLSCQRTFEDSTTLRFQARLVKFRTAFTSFAEAVAADIADLAVQTAASGLQSMTAADPATAAAAAGAV